MYFVLSNNTLLVDIKLEQQSFNPYLYNNKVKLLHIHAVIDEEALWFLNANYKPDINSEAFSYLLIY